MANRHRLCCNTYASIVIFQGKGEHENSFNRHGQTDWNKKKIQGHTNTALDSDGHRSLLQ